jgi:hypothetical protein
MYSLFILKIVQAFKELLETRFKKKVDDTNSTYAILCYSQKNYEG